MENSNWFAGFLVFPLIFAFVACSSTVELQKKDPPWIDRSGIDREQISKTSIERVLILPPDADSIGQFSELISAAERQFLKKGLEVVDPASLGELRELLKRDLSTVELAIKAGKQAGADAVVVTGNHELVDDESSDFTRVHGRRYLKDGGGKAIEIDRKEYELLPESQTHYLANKLLHYEGKLIGIEGGRVNASFNIWIPFVRIIDPFKAKLDFEEDRLYEQNYKWGGDAQSVRLKKRANDLLFQRIIDQIVSPDPKA